MFSLPLLIPNCRVSDHAVSSRSSQMEKQRLSHLTAFRISEKKRGVSRTSIAIQYRAERRTTRQLPRYILLWVLAILAVTLLSPANTFAQCGTCGCPAGQDCYCGSGSCYCVPGTPVIIDLNGDGIKLTSPQDGVQFNFFLNGPVQISWTPPNANEGWLVLPAKDGRVENGAQMFGNLTPQPPSEDPNGFLALSIYDDPSNGGNGDGVIDAKDSIFSKLRIWRDSNHNGISESWELISLPDAGIRSISLSYSESGRIDKWGNRLRYRSRVVSTDGTDNWAYDVILQFTNLTMSGDVRHNAEGHVGIKTAQQLSAKPARPAVMPTTQAMGGLRNILLRREDTSHRVALASNSVPERTLELYLIIWSRTLIGVLLTVAGVLKIIDFTSFRAAVRGFSLIPDEMTLTMAWALLLLEFVTGITNLLSLVFKDIVLRWASLSSVGLFAVFAVAIAINLYRGRSNIACGCFAAADADEISWSLVLRNALLAVIGLIGFQSLQAVPWREYRTETLGGILLGVSTLLAGLLVLVVRRLWKYGRAFTVQGGFE